jgi:hypothetical protein
MIPRVAMREHVHARDMLGQPTLAGVAHEEAGSMPAGWLARRVAGVLVAGLVVGAALAQPLVAHAADRGAARTPLDELIARHAPILMLKEQQRPCDTEGEPYAAGPVELVLGNPVVRLRQSGAGQPVAVTGPTAADVAGLDETYFLDLPGDPLRPGCGYERASRARMAELAPTASVHLAREEGRDGLVIQYWLFYYFNDFNNTHEGDWEMVQVVFDVDTVEEALQTEPVEVGYAQHGGGERAAWDDPKLEREVGRPIVYVSRGSHASQFDSAVYLGWGENGTGFGCDVTLGPSVRVPLEVRLIADSTGSVPPAASWTTFGGRWGQRGPWEFDGPQSPNLSRKWSQPLSWQDDLRDASLAVPLTGALGPAPTAAFCRVSAASATLFRTWAEQPWLAGAYVALALAIVGALLWATWHALLAALRLYIRHFPVFLPAGVAVIAVGVAASVLGLLGSLLVSHTSVADTPALWSIFMFLLGPTQQIASLVLIAPAAIYAASELRSGRCPGPRELLQTERAYLGRLVRALARPFVVIALLGLIPFGAFPAGYQYVRRSFIPQAVLLDDADSAEARAASARLVRGRWLKTACLVVTLTSLVVIPGPLVGILLLIYAARSVEFVNLASSLIYALVYPFVFVATTLYYIDRLRSGTPERS